ncbi:MAG: DsbA family protein, partial [Caldilineaceae bacterium]
NEPNPIFVEVATELGLDAEAFAACLLDPAMLALVEADATDGAAYVQGTPTFIVRYGNEGRIIPGALPEATFIGELEKVLAAVEGS